MTVEDAIGVVREHRWASADAQAKRLREDGIREVVSLNGGKKLKQVVFDDLRKFARPGTVFKLVWAFLIADPRKRGVAAQKADFDVKLATLTEKRGAVVIDVESGLTTAEPGPRRALVDSAYGMIGRSCQGLKSALNGKRNKGRPRLTFTADELSNFKAVWRDRVEYPTWDEVRNAYFNMKPDGFTVERAYKLWGPRS